MMLGFIGVALFVCALAFAGFKIRSSRVEAQAVGVAGELSRDSFLEQKALIDRLQQEGDLTQLNAEALRDELEHTVWVDQGGIEQASARLSGKSQDGTLVYSQKAVWTGLATLCLVIAFAVGMYTQLGAYKADRALAYTLDAVTPVVEKFMAGESLSKEEVQATPLADFAHGLQRWTQRNPHQVEGWAQLGAVMMNSAMSGPTQNRALLQYAQEAFQRALAVDPARADIAMQLIQVDITQNGGVATGVSKRAVEQLQFSSADEMKVSMLEALVAQRSGNHDKAISIWRRMLTGLEDPNQRRPIEMSLENALAERERLNAMSQGNPHEGGQVMGVQRSIEVTLSMSNELSIEPTAQLFITAKGVDSPIPLAVKKLDPSSVVDGQAITLSTQDAMNPQLTMGQVERVRIQAVLSQSGRVGREAGDWVSDVVEVDFNQPKPWEVSLSVDEQVGVNEK